MARPATKTDLLQEAALQYQILIDLIDSLSAEDQKAAFLFEDRDKNIRDVLIHLHEWHLMLEHWYHVGMVEKQMPATPAEGYTWRTLPDLNQAIWKKYQTTSLKESRRLLEESHQRVMQCIETHTNEEIFSKGVYRWTKTSTLGSYFVSSTSSHYVWAQKKIKKQIRLLKQVKKSV